MDPEPDDECAVDRAKRRADCDGGWSCENRRYFVIAHQYHRDVGSETEHRADREVEVAADHQEGHTDADDAELRCDRHHADEGFLGGKEVGTENRKDNEQGDDGGEGGRFWTQHERTRRFAEQDAGRQRSGDGITCGTFRHLRYSSQLSRLPERGGRITTSSEEAQAPNGSPPGRA